MKRVKVVGVGSPYGDDQAGWRVADALRDIVRRRTFGGVVVGVDTCDRPGVRLLDLMADCEAVVLVDALHGGGRPGTVHRLTLEDVVSGRPPLSSHGMALAEALALGAALEDLPPRLVVYGIGIDTVRCRQPGAALTPPVAAAVRAAADAVCRELERMAAVAV